MKTLSLRAAALSLAALTALAPLSAQADVAASGTFTGASDHVTTGNVSIFKTADGGALVILDSNFSLDGAPDPRVGFGKDDVFEPLSDLGILQQLGGTQVYKVPASVNVDDFNEVYIWCLKFGVPLGVAELS
ncbi:electron transfer DM13 [Litoreibacter ponti]|uniref:Electron transfer DM13 n=1 Tax=Litoreibacter ponti TaxID=1510457 RepID=A0A2T6BLS6_9RHOB|nr:DM13 domain-containing protein [Litoreibacter ponti]PTX56937.1 electron transfer DM13 [Litoreibacter ponti]